MTDGTYRTRSGALLQLRSHIAKNLLTSEEIAYNDNGDVTHISKNGRIEPVKEKQHPMDLIERLDGLHSFSENPSKGAKS
jgi:hypothetical protein